jgi:glycosyltransferase involved in cell wall biosynthesis
MHSKALELLDLPASQPTILVVAQTPPPVHGQAVMAKLLLDGAYNKIGLQSVRMAFSETIGEVGKLKLRKATELVSLVARIFRAKLQTKSAILYYLPASPNMVPFLRDVVILGLTRWMFRKTVFHFQAVGIGAMYARLPFILRALYRMAYFKPDLAICLTRATLVDAEHMVPRRTVVVPNAVCDRALGRRARETAVREESVPRILFLGMFCAEKGVLDLISACRQLDALKEPYRVAFAGASQSKEFALEAHRQAESLKGEVSFLGEVTGDAKWRLYEEADIFCFPTHYAAEGFPVVLVEAMMFGLPVVSTKWRGIPEIVIEGETGLLVEPGEVSALASSLKKLIDDPELRRSMGNQGRQRYAKYFTAEQFQKNMESVLAELATGRMV